MWYESTLVATIIGTCLGFALSIIPITLRSRRESKVLRYLLQAEIASIVNYSRQRLATYTRYRDLVDSGGALGIYYSNREMNSVYSAHRNKFHHFEKQYAVNVTEFYSFVSEFQSRASALSESLRAHHAGEDRLVDKEFFVGSLEKLIETIQEIVARGEKIIARAA